MRGRGKLKREKSKRAKEEKERKSTRKEERGQMREKEEGGRERKRDDRMDLGVVSGLVSWGQSLGFRSQRVEGSFGLPQLTLL